MGVLNANVYVASRSMAVAAAPTAARRAALSPSDSGSGVPSRGGAPPAASGVTISCGIAVQSGPQM